MQKDPRRTADSTAQAAIDSLDRVISKGIVNPSYLQRTYVWMEVFDLIDELKIGTPKEQAAARFVYLAIQYCRDRFKTNPNDLYSFRELDRVRARLMDCG